MADGAGSYPGKPLAVETPDPLVRFVPDRVLHHDGQFWLRGTLSFIPDPQAPEALSQWPSWVAGELAKGVTLFFADIDDATKPGWAGQYDHSERAKPLHAADHASATRLWRALFDPQRSIAPSQLTVLALSARGRTIAPLQAKIAAISQTPWTALADAIADGQSGRRALPLAIMKPSPPQQTSDGRVSSQVGALRIASVPAQELDGVLAITRAVRHLSTLPIRARGLSAFGAASEVWSTAHQLFSGGLAPHVDSPTPHADHTVDDDQAALSAVAYRGKAAALQAAQDHDTSLSGAQTSQVNQQRPGTGAGQTPFSRTPPAPRPEVRLSQALTDTMIRVRKEDLTAAQAAFDNHRQNGQGAPLQAAARPRAHEALAGWFTTQSDTLVDSASALDATVTAGLQDVFARHMLSLRPDPPVTFDGDAAWLDGEKAPAAQLHRALITSADTMNRRLFGIQAYPALARAVKLVVDVEVPITNDLATIVGGDHGDGWCLVGAVIGGRAKPETWTACKRSDALFTAVTAEEVAYRNKPPPSAGYASYEGVWNLAAADGASSRFSITTVDVVGGAEQFIQDADSAANDRRTGAILADTDQPPERGIGVAIVDGLRAEAAQAQNADAQTQAQARANGKPVFFYADQLTLGYRMDVAVTSRTTKSRTWRALGRRKVRFGSVEDALGRFEVEPIVEAALCACVPMVDGRGDVERYRADLDEVAHKPASRVVSEHVQPAGGDPDLAQAVVQQSVAQWDGSPLGAATVRSVVSVKNQAVVHPGDDLPLSVTFSLASPTEEPARPPRLEIGRDYRFALRHAFLGGVGHTVETASYLYDHAKLGPLYVPQADEDAIFRRPERVAAPVLTRLADWGPAPGELPGDNVGDVIVRSGDLPECQTSLARRIVYAPGLPMAFAIQHPTGRGGRVLDRVPVLNGRPLGGFINVALDPDSGGLMVRNADGQILPAEPTDPTGTTKIDITKRPSEGIFKVDGTDYDDLAARTAHYYPDPAIDKLVFELWTRGPNPRRLDDAHVEVPIYDLDYRQAADREIFGVDEGVPCTYPNAMPVLVEVHRGDTRQLLYAREQDTGTLSGRGDFAILHPFRTPDDDTVTARRVRLILPPGEDVDVRVWAWSEPEKLEWFRTFHGVTKVLGLMGGAKLHALGADHVASGAEKVFGLKRAASPLDSPAIRATVARHMAKLHATTPSPDQNEILSFRAVHAAQRPAAPAWIAGPPPAPQPGACPTPALPALDTPMTDGFYLLRATVADRDWPQWIIDHGARPELWWRVHQPGASMTWLGGDIAFDLKRANKLTLLAKYRDVRETPGKALPAQDKHGVFDFPWVGPTLLSAALDDDPNAVGAPAIGDQRRLDILKSLAGRPRSLVLHLPDSRAYRLKITPSASSRFIRMLRNKANAADEETYFTQRGPVQELWAPATVRPAPMAHVDLLPAFVWTEERDPGGGRAKSRVTRVRIAWKRPAVSSPIKPLSKLATAAWYSSGEGERLGIVFMPEGTPLGPASKLGVAGPFISRWGVDPIRTVMQKPDWALPANFLDGTPGMTPAPNQQMPYLGDPDDDPDKTAPATFTVDLQTFDPLYDRHSDTWFVDLTINPGHTASPWVQLGLVRYQEHAIVNCDQDLRVSRPASIGFRLEPFRKISVKALPRRADGKLWPVEVVVSGPLSFVNGGIDDQPSAALRDVLSRITRPRFKLKILREPFLAAVWDAGEMVVAETTSDGDPPPRGEELWRTTVLLDENPTGLTHHVFVEEVDPMMSAYPDEDHPERLVESGPRFMAKVKIRRD